jgi:hypothetical protein
MLKLKLQGSLDKMDEKKALGVFRLERIIDKN